MKVPGDKNECRPMAYKAKFRIRQLIVKNHIEIRGS